MLTGHDMTYLRFTEASGVDTSCVQVIKVYLSISVSKRRHKGRELT